MVGFAYIKRGGKNRRIYADDLVTEGVYAHVRNPMYVGNFLILVGLAVIWGSPVAFAIGVSLIGFLYFAIVVSEEAYLREKFGAGYDDYARDVNRFVPRLAGLRDTVHGVPLRLAQGAAQGVRDAARSRLGHPAVDPVPHRAPRGLRRPGTRVPGLRGDRDSVDAALPRRAALEDGGRSGVADAPTPEYADGTRARGFRVALALGGLRKPTVPALYETSARSPNDSGRPTGGRTG